MNNNAPTFAKQDSLKFLELSTLGLTVTLKKTTFRKQEIGDLSKKR
jgi:hypothetical protein